MRFLNALLRELEGFIARQSGTGETSLRTIGLYEVRLERAHGQEGLPSHSQIEVRATRLGTAIAG